MLEDYNAFLSPYADYCVNCADLFINSWYREGFVVVVTDVIFSEMRMMMNILQDQLSMDQNGFSAVILMKNARNAY